VLRSDLLRCRGVVASAALLGGQSDLSLAADSLEGRAEIEISWRNSMGVRSPTASRARSVSQPASAGSTQRCHGAGSRCLPAALEAAVAYAIADEAYRRVNEELPRRGGGPSD